MERAEDDDGVGTHQVSRRLMCAIWCQASLRLRNAQMMQQRSLMPLHVWLSASAGNATAVNLRSSINPLCTLPG
eukprot:1160845-Pelagomonas_calceolata.AAC.4